MLTVLAVGDVVGKPGRKALAKYLPELKKKYEIDAVVVNGENACHGFGISEKITKVLLDMGIDVITLGNHSWDQAETAKFIDNEPRLLRPLNYPELTPGKGEYIINLPSGKKIAVLQFLGGLFCGKVPSPFPVLEKALTRYKLKENVDAIVIDFHAETTSEKVALGHICDGKVSLVFGTHTHIPTADGRILSAGTAYITDVGMTGDYDSVIGMKKDEPIYRFIRDEKIGHLEPAEGEGTLCGVVVKISEETGLATEMQQIICGPYLENR